MNKKINNINNKIGVNSAQKKSRMTLVLIFATALAPIVLAFGFHLYYQQNPRAQTSNYGVLVLPQKPMPENLMLIDHTKTQYSKQENGAWLAAPQVEENSKIINSAINLTENSTINSVANKTTETSKISPKKPFNLSGLKGKWLFIYYNTAATCDQICIKHLYAMRQLRLSVGKDGARIIPVWLKSQAQLSPEMQKLYDNPASHLRTFELNNAQIPMIETWLNTNSQLPNAKTPQLQPQMQAQPMQGLYLIDPLGHYMMRYPNIEEPLKIIKDLKLMLKWSRIG